MRVLPPCFAFSFKLFSLSLSLSFSSLSLSLSLSLFFLLYLFCGSHHPLVDAATSPCSIGLMYRFFILLCVVVCRESGRSGIFFCHCE